MTPTVTEANRTYEIEFTKFDDTKFNYLYYYPTNGSNNGVTLNILDESELIITFSSDDIGFNIGNTINYEKNAYISIETTEATYYTQISESEAPDSFPDVVTSNLFVYENNAIGATTNYIIYLDYNNHEIRFVEN